MNGCFKKRVFWRLFYTIVRMCQTRNLPKKHTQTHSQTHSHTHLKKKKKKVLKLLHDSRGLWSCPTALKPCCFLYIHYIWNSLFRLARDCQSLNVFFFFGKKGVFFFFVFFFYPRFALGNKLMNWLSSKLFDSSESGDCFMAFYGPLD